MNQRARASETTSAKHPRRGWHLEKNGLNLRIAPVSASCEISRLNGLTSCLSLDIIYSVMPELTKLKLKIGTAEFEADGPAEVVQDQLRQFMEALRAAPSTTPVDPAEAFLKPFLRASHQQPESLTNGGERGASGSGTDSDIVSSFSRDELQRVFNVRNDVVSLRLLPPAGDTRVTDALLLVLYGHRVLRGEQQVRATLLLEGMRISGLAMDRLDRVADRVEQYLIRGGTRKGSRYTLNNPGVIRSEELLRPLLG